MEVSIMHHMMIVLLFLWLLSYFNPYHFLSFSVSFVYLFLVHERYVTRLQKKFQFEETKQANQKRILSDSETVRWLNHTVEKIWPVFMEQIASQKILLPIIPWFLEKFKPWTAIKALVQDLYLGRNPPLFTEIRVLDQSTGDDHLVMELGMNFCTADDMSAILAVQLRKRLGFGMWAKLHMTGMHVEGKVLVGVRFLEQWPYLGQLRICFVETPYFQMTVKPIFAHGLDVTELPGIAGWLDELLSVAFEQTLVQPNMLVVNMEKFASPQKENQFSMDVNEPVAYAIVEVIEASDMKPSDLKGLADPYVKGRLGRCKFSTKTQRRTLSPKWQEEFKIPICSWASPNMLVVEVRDKDHIVDNTLGDHTININDLRDGERHDMWLSLQNIKTGRLHLAITVLAENVKGGDILFDGEKLNKEEIKDSDENETANRASLSSALSGKSSRMSDNYEPINIEGQLETGVWIHHPGSDVSETWEPRKGKSRRADTRVHGVPGDSSKSSRPEGTSHVNNDDSSDDEVAGGKSSMNKVRQGLHKIGSLFHRRHKKGDKLGNNSSETVQSPYANIRAVNEKEISVKFMVEDSLTEPSSGKDLKDINGSSEESGPESPGKRNMKGVAKNISEHGENSACSVKHILSHKGSRKSQADSSIAEQESFSESDSSNDESLSSPQAQQVRLKSNPISSSHRNDESDHSKTSVQTGSSVPAMNVESQVKQLDIEGTERIDDDDDLSSSTKVTLSKEKLEGEKK